MGYFPTRYVKIHPVVEEIRKFISEIVTFSHHTLDKATASVFNSGITVHVRT